MLLNAVARIIILVLSYVELLTEDTSLSWGFERLNAYVKLTIGTEAANQGRSGWPQPPGLG